jgi:hypothetical protein
MNTVKSLLLIGILIILTASCVSIKTASTLNKAENKIIKFNEGIQNQIDEYPELVDKAYTRIEKVPVYIPGDSTKFKINLLKLDSLNKLQSNYLESISIKDKQIDSLVNIKSSKYNGTNGQLVIDQLEKRIFKLGEINKEQTKLTNYFLNKYNLELLKKVEYTHNDSIFTVDVIYQDGTLVVKPKVKDRWVITDVEKTNYNINVRKHFWQDIKFWGFLIVLVNFFYFFNNLFFNILDFIFTAIKTFIRKIFIKL